MIHEHLHAAEDSRDILLYTAEQAAEIILLVVMRRFRLLLHVALDQENPSVAYVARLAFVDACIDCFDGFVLLGGMRFGEHVASECALFAFPDLSAVVHAGWNGACGETLFHLLAHRPCAFAEAPVVVVLVWAAIHHFRLACGSVAGSVGWCA